MAVAMANANCVQANERRLASGGGDEQAACGGERHRDCKLLVANCRRLRAVNVRQRRRTARGIVTFHRAKIACALAAAALPLAAASSPPSLGAVARVAFGRVSTIRSLVARFVSRTSAFVGHMRDCATATATATATVATAMANTRKWRASFELLPERDASRRRRARRFLNRR